jgi:hypothetical protein
MAVGRIGILALPLGDRNCSGHQLDFTAARWHPSERCRWRRIPGVMLAGFVVAC